MNRITPLSLLAAALALAACSGTPEMATPDTDGARQVRFAEVDARTLTYPELGEIELPEIRRVELDNGLTILLTEDRGLPLVRATARIGMGSLWDPADHVGLAGLTAQTMRSGGAGDLDPDALNEALENVGASVEVFAGNDGSTASMTTLTQNLDTVLPLFVDVLLSPRFDAEKVELAKTQTKSGISRRNDSPQGIASRELFNRLYAEGSPYAYEEEYYTIDNVSREDIQAFHAEYVRPENTIMAVYGDFDAAEMEGLLREAFSGWTGTGAPTPEAPEVVFNDGPGVFTVEKEDTNQSTVLIGHPGSIRLDHPDYPAVVIMNQVLGGGFGSRLFQVIRSDLGYAYSVGGSYNAGYTNPGVFFASTNTRSESTVEAAQAMLEVIEDMKTTPPTADELALAKDSYLNSYVFRFDTKAEVLGRLLTYEYYGYPEDFLVQLQEGIAAVTAADVQRVAQTYLRPESAKILILGNSADFTTPVSALGEAQEVDITIPTGDPNAAPEASGDPAAGAELLGRVFAAVGGREAWDAINGYASAGSFTGPTPFGEATIATQSLIGGADKIRVEQATPVGNILLQLNGNAAALSVGGAAQPVGPGFAGTIRSQLLFSVPYLMAFPEGLEVARMADTDDGMAVLRITASGVPAPYDLVVGEDGKPVRIESTQPGQAGPVRLVYAFSDYREMGGVMLPFTTVQTTGGQPAGTTTLETFTPNPEMPEGSFGG